MRNIDREINLVEDNQGIQIELTCQDFDLNPVDLTGKTVHLYVRRSGSHESTNASNSECLITDALGGLAVYTVQSGDFPLFGTYFGDVEIRAGAGVETAPEVLRFVVREKNR